MVYTRCGTLSPQATKNPYTLKLGAIAIALKIRLNVASQPPIG